MRYTILFIIVLISVSGFIAYFGDLLGRRMGKKRLTLWNLRPRHTAIIVTTITGMLISALVLLTLVTVNSQYKKIILQGERIISQNEQLSKSNILLQNRNQILITRGRVLENEVRKQQEEVNKARQQALKAEADRDKARKEVARLQREAARLQRDISALRKRTYAAERELNRRNAELRAVQLQLKTAQAELQKADKQLVKAREDLILAQTKLVETNTKLQDASNQLIKQQALLKEQEEKIQAQDQLIKEMDIIKQKLEKSIGSAYIGDLIYAQGDEIARAVISPKQSDFGIRSDLIALLKNASEKAKKRGAVEGTNGRAVRLYFYDRKLGIDEKNENICIDMAVATIKSSVYHDVLIQLVAFGNSTAGEPVLVEIRPYLNYLIYRKGDKIAEATIDASSISEGRILLSVINFLQRDVGKAALEKGVIPIAGSSRELSMSADAEEQVDDLMQVVERISVIKSKVKLEAYALSDIYAADILNLKNIRLAVRKVE